jgi:hypothetical protein
MDPEDLQFIVPTLLCGVIVVVIAVMLGALTP